MMLVDRKREEFRTVNGVLYRVMTAKEWDAMSPDYKGIVAEDSPLHTDLGWWVGTKTALAYTSNGTGLCPVIIEG